MKNKIIVLLIAIIFLLASSLLVFKTENSKLTNKVNSQLSYYSDLFSNWVQYKKDYDTQVLDIITKNKDAMDKARTQYIDLLAQQPGLIAEHTKSVTESTQTTPTANTQPASVSSSGSGTVSVKKSKPASKPKTSSS